MDVAADGTIFWLYQADGSLACTAEISADGQLLVLQGLTQFLEESVSFTYIGEASGLVQPD
jgi:hypothetical protein